MSAICARNSCTPKAGLLSEYAERRRARRSPGLFILTKYDSRGKGSRFFCLPTSPFIKNLESHDILMDSKEFRVRIRFENIYDVKLETLELKIATIQTAAKKNLLVIFLYKFIKIYF